MLSRGLLWNQPSTRNIGRGILKARQSTSSAVGIHRLVLAQSRSSTISQYMLTTGFLTVIGAGLYANGLASECTWGKDAYTQCKSQNISSINNIAPTKEPKTGILFPKLCNGLTFTGCGVRVKYGFVKVYAVGTYMDPIAMSAVKKQDDLAIEKALLDPMYPRTLRIVMNRSLSIAKYTAAIIEALEPRMGGEDLEKLKEFQEMNPPGDLVEGAEMTMTIRGDTMLYRNCAGGVGAIHSEVFCKALCDTYYGSNPVSPDHKADVIKGIKKL